MTSLHIELPERYRVLRHVASGGMAAVYAADDVLLGRQVAVKVLSPAFAADEHARARFTREARAAARLSDHPHVVTIYDIGQHGDNAFIVMELLPGGTLNDRLKRGDPIPHGQAIAWLGQIASALDAAHRLDVVHRDVKPANLLLDDTGAVRVGDFGIATLASEASITQTGQVVGTAAYLSPEQALGRPATAASDRYALAVVAFELLTGRRPFTAAHPAAQALAHVDTVPPEASHVAANLPPAVDGVLSRGMAKDPDERPPTAAALVDELEGALGATAATLAVTAPTRRWHREAPPAGVAIPDPDRPPTPRPGALPPPVRSRHASSRMGPIALIAALVLIAGAAVAAIAGGGDDGAPTGDRAASTPAKRTTSTPKRTTTTAPPTAAATPATTAAAAPATDPSAIQAQAHQLIGQGRLDEAIAMLAPMVGGCPVTRTDPCAYAFFDLGHALRRAGRPAEAIPVLEQRLQNPNQRGAVMAELRAAMQEAGGGKKPKRAARGWGDRDEDD